MYLFDMCLLKFYSLGFYFAGCVLVHQRRVSIIHLDALTSPNRNWASQEGSSVPALISGFCSMRRLGAFVLPLDGILVHRRLPPSSLSGCP